ncbi:MAG: hydroxymethylglutaryl-CoA lyase [Syntrophobacterales bacterium]|nr:hydroxymethylglutaryl-CoA lyase [Syntrophobacterales bacterium]
MILQPERITLEDQTLRDGIQREAVILSTTSKIEFIQQMMDCGIDRFQVTAFVNPKKVPQMADAEKLIVELQKFSEASFFALVLNLKGLERALRCGCRNVEISISASNTHGLKNVGMGLREALNELDAMLKLAIAEKALVKMSVQCAFGCQYEGSIPEDEVIDLLKRGLDRGVQELSLADTTGMAYPELILQRVSKAKEVVAPMPLFLHLHDPDGRGISNLMAGIEAGVRHFDATLGGTGGCPFIPYAPPNIALEVVVEAVSKRGFITGVRHEKLVSFREAFMGILKGEPCSIGSK